jgi:hypothetical protein
MSGWSLRSRHVPSHPDSPPQNDLVDSEMNPRSEEAPAAPANEGRAPASTQSFEARFQALESTILALGEQVSHVSFPHLSPLPPANADPANSSSPVNVAAAELPGHPVIAIRNRRYSHVLSISTYRLRDRTSALLPDQVSNLTSAANQIRPRLEGCFFTGDPPLSVLPFLHQVVRVADQSHMSEATLLWVVEDFLRSPVKEAFRSQNLNMWPEAVHWLLVTYASEQTLDAALRRMQTNGQSATETVRQYGLRLQLESASFGSLLSSAEVKSLFSQGIRDPVRSLFAANQPPGELEDTTPLSVLISRAELLESGTRSIPSSSTRLYSRTSSQGHPTVMLLPHEDPPREIHPDESPDVLAIEARRPTSSSDTWTCFVCYKKGHGWLDCPLLSHVSTQEKEEILLRRRTYLEQIRPGSPRSRSPLRTSANAVPRTGDRTSVLHRPASQKNGPTSPRM